MSSLLKVVVIFSMGVAVGAVTADILLAKKYEDLVQEEIDSIKATRTRGVDVNSKPSGDEEDEEDNDESEHTLVDNGYKKVARRYNTVEPNEEVVGPNVSLRKPYIITIEQFSEEEPDYEKTTIHYYRADDTFADEDGESITDSSLVVGDSTASYFWNYEEYTDEPDVVYIRNDKLETDYEVICLARAYFEMGKE